ncbi:hypothetical protein HCR_05370 [Hydrogenimonas cancrithermarum]|uniref:histidine kinase n=2 Tax=Hydrogenimonas cancrithermarum TaxID=2993563 RepID=A0ABM8FIW4_9BACT|nr:hypothetical protein HCR_05370 [Hydrogenimonas cancrithermarum]
MIMLTGLFVATIVLFAIFAVVALYVGYADIFYTKLSLAVIMALLLTLYRYSYNTPLFALLFLILIEFESVSAMFGGHFYDFVTIYPFFSIFGFFFFFTLRTALWLTLGHYVFWIAFALYNYNENADNPVFHLVPLMNMVSTTLVVILIAFLYHISTEVTYKRLEHANKQKELLIKEIHHRIKNNLNKIASMLGLQILRLRRGRADSIEEILTKNKLRIQTMAMVHEALYKAADLESVEAAGYIENLIDLIQKSYGRTISTKIRADGISLPLETMLKLGMILNELYTNTLKHAHGVQSGQPEVEITLVEKEGRCQLFYRQVGQEKVDLRSLKKGSGLGMTLVRLSAEEMDGSLEVRTEDHVLLFDITFKCA